MVSALSLAMDVSYRPLTFSKDSEPYKTYFKCIGIDEKFNGDWSLLRLEEYTDDSCLNILGNGSRIIGLSSLKGILYNNRFEVDGFGSLLLEVSDNEKILYSNMLSGILEITDPSIPIKVDRYIFQSMMIFVILYIFKLECIQEITNSAIYQHV